MTKAILEFNKMAIVVTVLASYDEHYKVCLMDGHVVICANTHLYPCFQPDEGYLELIKG